jgi:hypothetical protein
MSFANAFMKPPFHITLTSVVEQHAPDVHARFARKAHIKAFMSTP